MRPFFYKYKDEDGCLLTDVTAVPRDAYDDYVSSCIQYKTNRVGRHRSVMAWDAENRIYGEKSVDIDCIVHYPTKDINEMIRILKRRARKRNLAAFFHKANLVKRLYLAADRLQGGILKVWAFIVTTPLMLIALAALGIVALIGWVILFGAPFLATAFWVYLGYLFATVHKARFVGICTAAISLHIWLTPLARTLFKFANEWLTVAYRNPSKRVKSLHRSIIDKYSTNGRGSDKGDYLIGSKEAPKRYFSFREEDNYNVSQRLSELSILKMINNPKGIIDISMSADDKWLRIKKKKKPSSKKTQVILLKLSCVVYKYDAELLLNEPGDDKIIDSRVHKIDLLNHVIVAE